jgi:N-acetylglutamate synthase-like GNAT family acetyltransferase
VYAQEHGLDADFEGYVALGLGEWITTPPAGPGRLWVAEADGRIVGCVGLTGDAPTLARLRWFLVDPSARGSGLGRSLFDTALGFAREAGYGSVVLETFSELAGAAHLYRAAGFERVDSWTGPLWGRDDLVRERYELAPL